MSDYTLDDLADAIQEHLRRNKDWLSAVVGDRGAGKSRTTFRIAWVLDALFNRTRVIQNMEDYRRLMKEADELPPGTFIIIDEAILLLFKQDFATKDSKAFVKFVNTFRFRKWVTMFLIPHWGSLNKEVRKHFHQMLEIRDLGTEDRVLAYVFDRGRLRQFSDKPPAMHFRGAMPIPNKHRWKDPECEREVELAEARKARLDGGLRGILPDPGEDAWQDGLDTEVLAIDDILRQEGILVQDAA